MKFVEFVKLDLYRYAGQVSLSTFLHHYYYSEGFRYIFYYRLASSSSKWSILRIIGRFYHKNLGYKYGFQIPVNAKIGSGLSIVHFGNIVINSKAVIGCNCNLYHGVTIGVSFRGKNKGVPVIEDCVWIGTGSVIVGGITIGSNVLIAPNSYVNFSIPSNSVVLGNPAKVIPKSDATEGYILNKV